MKIDTAAARTNKVMEVNPPPPIIIIVVVIVVILISVDNFYKLEPNSLMSGETLLLVYT